MKTLEVLSHRLPSVLSLALLLICLVAPNALAQCEPDKLDADALSKFEKNSLVIDVRPDEINQFKGKSSFKNEARIVLINMNPFLFSYSLKVDQTEIQDTGFLNFLNLLGSPVSDLIGSVSASSRSQALIGKALASSQGGNLKFLIKRTVGDPKLIPGTDCSEVDGQTAIEAIKQIKELRDALLNNILIAEAGSKEREAEKPVKRAAIEVELNKELPADWQTLTEKVEKAVASYEGARIVFQKKKNVIFDSSVDAEKLCTSANELLTGLERNRYAQMSQLKDLKKEISDFKSLVKELRSSALDYKSEYGDCPTRIKGLNYADNIGRLAEELGTLADDYEAVIDQLMEETKGYDALKETIAKLENKRLQREYTVFSQYDISALDITATAVPLGEDSGLPRKEFNPQRVIGETQSAQRASAQSNARIINVGATDSAQGVRVLAPHRAVFRAQAAEGDGEGGNGGGNGGDSGGGAKQIKTSGTIGARRFELSAGMVFSGLDRREFKPVIGYPTNAQGQFIDPATGNTTNDPKLTQIVGISEDSTRRFAPLAMLHYRLPFHRKTFLSAGFTGSNDDYGVNLEYFLGPSVLYKNMFFSFGGYAGKQQRLAGDLYQGAPVEGDFPVRKDYRWGWAFSFTYKLPLGSTTNK